MNRVITEFRERKNLWVISSNTFTIEAPKYFKRMIVSGGLTMGGLFAVNIFLTKNRW